jgi:multiple sugar transport system permease protein/putative aldouronate transport system permease protein
LYKKGREMSVSEIAKREAKAEREYMKKHKSAIRQKPSDVVFNVINYLVFAVFTLVCIFPFYYLFINTISDNELVRKGLINFVPRGIHFENYIRLLQVNDLFGSFGVTLARTILGTLLMVLASAFVGYLVTQQDMWGRSFWYRFLVITMYFNAGIIPWYLNMAMLGLTNKFWAYIIPGIVAPYNIILVKTYIESAIPGELQESASLDGASHLKIFLTIILPLSKPILATIAIFGAVGHWNSFQDSLILMQSAPQLYTLQHRLYIYLNTTSNLAALMSAGSTSGISKSVLDSALNGKVIKYTIAMVTIIPILLVYPFMQRYFEKGIMIGAVKG